MLGGVCMKREVVIRSRAQLWLDVSVDLLHGAAWLGVYFFLKTLLPVGKPVTCAGIGIVICFVLECLLRYDRRFLSGHYSIQWHVFAEAVLLFFYGGFEKDPLLRVFGIVLGILCVLAHFWCVSLQGMQEYLEQNAGLKNVPEEGILRGNTGVVSRILAGMALLFAGVALFRSDASVAGVKQFFRMLCSILIAVIRRIIHFLEGFSGGDAGSISMTPAPAATRLAEVIPDDHAQGLGMILILCVVGLLIIYVFARMILSSQGQPEQLQGQRPVFHRRGSGKDVVEKLEDPEKSFLFFRNNRERIRYLFKKQVMSYYHKRVPGTFTAGELRRDMQTQDPWIQTLQEAYEVARYSERTISRQEVHRLKKSRKNS